MNHKLAWGFALRNLKANRYLEIPFLIAGSIMLVLFNIMASLLQNDYVRTRHESLPMIFQFGLAVTAVFTFVFILYTNRFLVRRRNKEFALYGILGLEKRHIGKILLIEHLINYLVISLLTLAGGFVFGKLAFLGVNRLMKDRMGKIMHYPFSVSAMVITLFFIVFLFLFVYVWNLLSIRNASPIELLGRGHRGEGEPKNRLFLLAAGLVLLAAGYGIALGVEGSLRSLLFLFLAVLLVILATYALFVSLSIFILRLQKSKPAYFYRPHSFLSVSGMLYRMKSSAVGLATVCVLSTGVIISLAATLTIYRNIENSVAATMRREYMMSDLTPLDESNVDARGEAMESMVREALGEGQAEDYYDKVYFFAPVYQEGDRLVGLTEESKTKMPLYAVVTTLDSYNAQTGQKHELVEDEILVSANSKAVMPHGSLQMGDEFYRITEVDNNLPGNLGIEAIEVVVPTFHNLTKLAEVFPEYDFQSGTYSPSPIARDVGFNAGEKARPDFAAKLQEAAERDEDTYAWQTRAALRKEVYEMDGGFLFLGIIVGILFLAATILLTYYKQLSEGSEDRDKFAIMKRVGLPDELIRRTANAQVVWMFFLPLAAALIHSAAAARIIFQLLGLFGVRRFTDYGSMLAVVAAVFAVVYFINFKLTSYIYYKEVR